MQKSIGPRSHFKVAVNAFGGYFSLIQDEDRGTSRAPLHGGRHNATRSRIVAVRRDESFKVWSHGYPYRTVRWHFHPEYEIHLIVATTGKMFVGDHISSFAPGNLVLMGPNLPHNWVSDVPEGETIAQRNLVVQFGQEFVSDCIGAFRSGARSKPARRFAPRRVVRSQTSARSSRCFSNCWPRADCADSCCSCRCSRS